MTSAAKGLWCFLFAIGLAQAVAADDLDDRRQRVAAMSSDEKEELHRRQERFAALDTGEQDRLRALHRDLEADSDSEHLRQVMSSYHHWLTSLPPYRRAELQQLEPAERIKRIKALLREQSDRDRQGLSIADVAALSAWMDRCASRQESQFLEFLPESQRQEILRVSPTQRHRYLFCLAWLRWQKGGSSKPAILTDDDLAEIQQILSENARKRMADRSIADQRGQASHWIKQLVQQEMTAGRLRPWLPPVREEELAKFFEKDLNDEQRDNLMSMPADQMIRELRQMYSVSPRRAAELAARAADRGKKPGSTKKPNRPGTKGD